MNSNIDRLIESLSSGLIYVLADKTISLFNSTAKEIIGMSYSGPHKHSAGHIKSGDIVLMATTDLGGDDGGLTSNDLSKIGIRNKDIRPRDTVIAIGRYKTKTAPMYKYYRAESLGDSISIESQINKNELGVYVDFDAKTVTLKKGDILYSMRYMVNLGSIVIIDPKTMDTKFYQAKGYSYRGETIKEILNGKEFSGKAVNYQFNLVDQNIEDVFPPSIFLDDIEKILQGSIPSVYEKLYSIHQRYIIGTMNPVRDGEEITGVSIELTEATNIEALLENRNKIIQVLEDRMNRVLINEDIDDTEFKYIKGFGEKTKNIKHLIKKATKVQSTVFITGENGTGKTIVAREIHYQKNNSKPFVEINCASIPVNLFESELFGYTAGSFTGALPGGKKGYLESAKNGTIFLDEITEIPPSMQGKLLHVLQDKRFYPIGSNVPVEIDARIIAATNRDIKHEISTGRFREDLYYRLNVFTIHIPPLRERVDDMYTLIPIIMRKIETKYGLQEKEISASVLDLFLHYEWPGNIRELENVLERAILTCDTRIIFPEHVSLNTSNEHLTLKDIRELAEKNAIQNCLLLTKNKSDIAKQLGISRTTLYEKMAQYDLNF